MVNCTYLALSDVDWHNLNPTYFIAVTNEDSILINGSVLFLTFSFQSVSLYLSADVFIQAWARFKRWKSLYFWSLIASASLLIIYLTNIIVMELTPSTFRAILAYNVLYVLTIGCLPTAFALLLYSRLHTIVQQSKAARIFFRCLWILILFTFAGYFVPVVTHTVIFYVRKYGITGPAPFTTLNAYIWYFEVYHVVMEDVLACLYVWYFYRFMLEVPEHLQSAFKHEARVTMTWLLACAALNVVASVFRLVIIGDHLQLIQTEYFGLQYALRLKVEFVVLNRLAATTEAKALLLARGNLSNPVGAPITVDATNEQPRQDGDVEKGLSTVGVGTRFMVQDIAAVDITENNGASTSAMGTVVTVDNDAHSENIELDRLERLYLGRSS